MRRWGVLWSTALLHVWALARALSILRTFEDPCPAGLRLDVANHPARRSSVGRSALLISPALQLLPVSLILLLRRLLLLLLLYTAATTATTASRDHQNWIRSIQFIQLDGRGFKILRL